MSGSSPRAWGILAGIALDIAEERFIPTCVGNTGSVFTESAYSTVHPHVRGEYIGQEEQRVFAGGSSPRAWGILFQQFEEFNRTRFIPTCVGNTTSNGSSQSINPVHPHVRGEYQQAVDEVALGDGSSPRAWGIPALCGSWREPDRFIPTCVGNTYQPIAYNPHQSVHPHVRGEYGNIQTVTIFVERFIPTCVGNTAHGIIPTPRNTVHPHVRGEYSRDFRNDVSLNGSSPRAWGIRSHLYSSLSSKSVHPHVRGEYAYRSIHAMSAFGSSPRAWGIRWLSIWSSAAFSVHPHVRGEYFDLRINH